MTETAVSVLVPGADLVPSVTSRIVTVDVADMTEGAPGDGSVTFILPLDLHVAADNRIIQAGSETITLANGHGEIRLPCYDPDAVTQDGSSDWAILVKKSWQPHPYAIRVPVGTGAISLADLASVRPLTARERAYAITGTSVSIVEGAAWNASVALLNGMLSFVFTVPPSDMNRWWKVVHRDFTTGMNFDTMTEPGIWSTRLTDVANSLVNSPTSEPVMLRNEWGGIKADGTPTFTVQTVTTTSADHAPIVWQRNVWSTGSKSAWAQRGDIGARLVEVAESSQQMGTGLYGVLSSRTIADAPPGESGGLAEIKVGDAAWVQMWQRWTASGAVDLLTRSNGPTLTGTWQRPESPRAVEWARQQLAQIIAATTAPRTDGTFPSSAWSAPAAAQPLGIPTPDGSGQATHPSVTDMGSGQTWNGHRYWMAYTPYKYASDALEDPCVAWSDNGAAWTAATGAFPLDDAPGGASYNSDTDLTISNGTAYVLWRAIESGATKLYWRTSTNGSTWTAKQLIWNGGVSLFSPSLVRQGTGWRMWVVGGGAGARKVGYMDSAVASPGPSDWSSTTWVTTPLPAGREPWHVEVLLHAGRWWGLLTDTILGQNGVDCRVRLMQSDGGTTWDVSPTELVPALGHTHDSLYRASMALSGTANSPAMDLWYSGLSADKGWWIYRTTPAKVDPAGSTGGASTIAQVTGLQAALDARPPKMPQPALNTNMDALTDGHYQVSSWTYANSYTSASGKLPDVGPGDLIVTTNGSNAIHIWRGIGGTSNPQGTWQRQRNSGTWSAWHRLDTPVTDALLAPRLTPANTPNLDTYNTPGFAAVWSDTDAAAILNSPPDKRGFAMQTIAYGSAVVQMTWSSSAAWYRFNGGGGWFAWAKLWPAEQPTTPAPSGWKRVPMAVTAGVTGTTLATTGTYRIALSDLTNVPAGRWRLHATNRHIHTGTPTGTGIVLTDITIGTDTGNGAMSDPVTIGTLTLPNDGSDAVTAWQSTPLDKMLLSYHYTATTHGAMHPAGAWTTSTNTATQANPAGMTRVWSAPCDLWIELEVPAATPVLAVFGDSLSVGVGATLPLRDSVVSQYAASRGIIPVHWAVSGDGWVGWAASSWKLTRWAHLSRADAVLVAMGSNDLFGGGKTAVQVQASATAYLPTIRAGIAPTIFWATIPPRTNVTGAAETERRTYNAWLGTLPGEASDSFNLAAAVSTDDETITALFDADGVHPNTSGYAAQAAAITRPVVPVA